MSDEAIEMRGVRMIAIDHIGVLARDVAASARFLAEILGLAPSAADGPDGEMFRLPIGESGALLYFPADEIPGLHIAFRVDESTFDTVVDRLRARGLTFGNDPDDQTNMQVNDFLGGYGRVFFLDPNGHLFEVIA
jgi:catechol 2,3-dioxygenase-like lactoylglutathione lyase family enzyme